MTYLTFHLAAPYFQIGRVAAALALSLPVADIGYRVTRDLTIPEADATDPNSPISQLSREFSTGAFQFGFRWLENSECKFRFLRPSYRSLDFIKLIFYDFIKVIHYIFQYIIYIISI